MAMKAAALVAIALLLAPKLGRTQERPAEVYPHGLPFESSLALSPEAYEFFHPSERAHRGHGGVAPALAPRGQLRESVVRGGQSSTASVARADREEGGVEPVRPARRGGARASVVAGVFFGAVVVVVAALGLAYAVARRRVAHADAEAVAAPKSNA